MKTKIKLVQQGCKNHPIWRLVVQGEKKNLHGRYIEHIGMWMPRHARTYRRGMLLNKHKTRYWLGVGAQPTKGVIRVLEKFDFFPRYPVAFGSKSLYEKPKRTFKPRHFKDLFKSIRNPDNKFKEMLRSQMNLTERSKLIQAEALDKLGAAEIDLEQVKTDDFESEEGDVFQRFEKFQELNRRFAKHREENLALRGNDLRYNVYMKKMQKMVRMDVGLDVEAFKDYVNNTKEFAKVNHDWEIFGKEDLSHPAGIFVGGKQANRYASVVNDEDQIEKRTIDAQWAERTKRVQTLVIKLLEKGRMQIFDKDYAIVEEFASNPQEYMNRDGNLAIDMKKLYDKRKLDLADRASMGVNNIEKVTDAILKERGVSKREFALIKKFLDLDPEIFAVKEYLEASPFTHTVDLSKYEGKKIPQECKDILYRPKKMRLLYERYWQLASQEDINDRDAKLERNKLRFHPRFLSKLDEEFKLMDKFVAAVDNMLVQNEKTDSEQFDKEKAGRTSQEWLDQELEDYRQVVKGTHPTLGFRKYLRSSGFEYEADKIRHQLKNAGFCTKSQLDFLMLYAEYEQDANAVAQMKDIDLKNITVVKDKDERKTDMALAQINQLLRSLRKGYRYSDSDNNTSNVIYDALKSLDLTKLESKDLSLENIAQLTGLQVADLIGDIPNRRFKEVVDLSLQGKLRAQNSLLSKFDQLYTQDAAHATGKRQRDEANKSPFAEEEEESWIINEDVQMSQEKEEFLKARLNEMGIVDKNARATAIQKVRNDIAKEQVNDALNRERSRLINQKGRNMLSDELRAKFDLLDAPIDFAQRSAILSWAVDEMRTQVIDHLELSGFMDKLSESERVDLIFELNQIQSASSDKLFKLHEDQKNGVLVEENDYLQPLIHQIEKLRDKVSLASVEADLFKMMKEHNQKVDEFTRKFDQRDMTVLDELRKTDLFENKLEASLPDFHTVELRVSAEANGFDLDHELRKSAGEDEYPDMSTWTQEKIDAAEDDFDLVKYQLENTCVTMSEEELAVLQNKFFEHQALRISQDSFGLTPTEQDEKEVERMIDDLVRNMNISNRLGLEWDKLFQGRGGGYDLATLTKALERVKKDRENGITFFDDENQNAPGAKNRSRKMQQRLMSVLEKRRAAAGKNEAAQEGEAEEAEEQDDDEEGEKIPTVMDNLLKEVEGDEESTQIMKEVIDHLRDEMKAEAAEDGREYTDMFSLKAEEYQVLYKMFIEDRGLHLQIQWDQDDKELYDTLKAEGKKEDPEERRVREEAREEELTEWLKVKFEGCKIRKRRPKLQPHEAKHRELMADNQHYLKIVKDLVGDEPYSYADNTFMPDIHGAWDELERIESNLGRYPHGFRHYENYHNYLQKFPKANINDYQQDMNSQITFDEYLVMKQAHTLYELKYDPQVMYSSGLFNLESDDPMDRQRIPDQYVRGREFRDETKHEYQEEVRNALLERSHYTKVEALENFSDLYDMGRGPKHRPTANEYHHVPINIMQRPKFRDMDKEDEVGEDFTYRNRDGESVAPAIMPLNTLKPQKFEPAIPRKDSEYLARNLDRNDAEVARPMRKWSKYRRLSKSRRTNFTFVQMATPWRNFGSLVEREQTQFTEEEQTSQPKAWNELSAPLMRPFLNTLGSIFFNMGAFKPKK